MPTRRKPTRKRIAHIAETPNGTRVTVAVLGQKVDAVACDVRDLKKEHDQHVADGRGVLERLSALEGKATMLMWGAPIFLTAIGVVSGIIFALR